ncbi:MAG TPA: EAL domain-containing protein [Blastocatellia bacterium]|nr:EAL domain-containing protein [Blastocatellia bacterium]
MSAREFTRSGKSTGAWGEPLEALQSAIDGLSAHIAVLDNAGTIIMVNAAWRSFASANEFAGLSYGIGANYLTVCESASGIDAPEATVVAQGIHDILSLQRHSFQLEYPAHCPWEKRWFRLRVTSFEYKGSIGAVVAHENITEHKRAHVSVQQAHQELERQVAKRTAELSKANTFLREQISERNRAESKVSYLAYHDQLTKLPNRVLITDRLMQAVSAAQRNPQILAVMLLSLDRLKSITDTLGMIAGDKLLQGVAERLSKRVHESDTLGFMGGSEFAIMLTQIGNSEKAVEAAQHILGAFESPFKLEGQDIYLTCSLGISMFPDDGKDAQSLVRNASAALERAKELSGNSYQFYTANMNAKAMKQLSIEHKIRQALTRNEFTVFFQPQLDLISGQVVGSEALCRWIHPEMGMVSPGEFIPIAEASGLIVPIGEFVLRMACKQTKVWEESGLASLRIAVNISAHQFQKPNLVQTVAEILGETGLDPKKLELELTESAVMKNPETAIATLRELKAMGLQISIDDFGTGYSSLSYLKRFPLDILKIDQSFMRDATKDPNDAAIVKAIITLAHSLNLLVIAEGVETEEQLHFLRQLGCDEMQGFLFSRPLPADDMKKLLMDGLLTGWTKPIAPAKAAPERGPHQKQMNHMVPPTNRPVSRTSPA